LRNGHGRCDLKARKAGTSVIERRHVLYVEGYDPQGAEGYYRLFQRELNRSRKIWPWRATLAPLEIDSEFLAHWEIEAAAPNWRVHTRYEFLRQEQIVRANLAEPMPRQLRRVLWWIVDYLVSGTMYRIFRISWRHGLALVYFQLLLLAWLSLSSAIGALAGFALTRLFDIPWWAGGAAGIIAAIVCFLLLRPLADRWFVVQINNHWPHLCEFARGEPNCFDRAIDAAAERLVAVARANAVDEILVIGHSGGGVLGPALVARALELDCDVGRHGPRVVLMTLGSIMPSAGLHPKAERLRAIVKRLAVEPSISWIDVQSTKDVLNYENFDPVAGIGVDAGARRCNPLTWQVRFRDMLTEQFYDSIRFNYFRFHYQFIMANDMRAPYDYFMLVCGPLAPEHWAKRERALLAEFAEDARFLGAPAGSPAAG
jgi:pimeloyl-ACP methyl ester carboxylesterase